MVPEMLLALSWLQVELVHEMFVLRFGGDLRGETFSWRHLLIVFLPKCRQALEMNDFRGICLLDVLGKWYMQGLMMLFRRAVHHMRSPAWHRLMVMGYESNHSTTQLAMSLNLLLQKGQEWRGQQGIFIGAGDVKAAFDNLTLQEVLDSLLFWQFEPNLIRALLEESMELTAVADFPGTDPTEHFGFNKCIRQGGVEAPWEWNAVMRKYLAILVPSWQERGMGVHISHRRSLTHVVWADTLYFLATSLEQLRITMQEFSDLLVQGGMQWKHGSLQMLSPGSTSNPCCC